MSCREEKSSVGPFQAPELLAASCFCVSEATQVTNPRRHRGLGSQQLPPSCGPALPQGPPNPEMFRWKMKALLTGSCLTTSSPPDCGLPGSSVRGILQAGVLERAAMPSSQGSFQSRDQTCMSCVSALQIAALSLSPQGSPYRLNRVLNRRHFHILTPQELQKSYGVCLETGKVSAELME